MAFKDPSLFENKIDHNTVYWWWWGGVSLNIDVMVRYLPNILKHCKFMKKKKKISPMINLILALGFYIKTWM